MKNLETSVAIHERTKDGILISRVRKDGYETLEYAKENGAALMKLKGEDPPMPLLVDFLHSKGQAAETRRYYAEESFKWASRVALMVDSPVSRVIGNIYMGLNKPKVPTKLFSNEQEAIAWLKSN